MEYVEQLKEGIRMKENGKMYTRKSVALWTAASTHAHTRAHKPLQPKLPKLQVRVEKLSFHTKAIETV